MKSKTIRVVKGCAVSVLLLVALPLFSGQPVATLSSSEANRIVDAIYQAEGGARARVPYGILSVKVKDAPAARQVCLNTVINNYRRWQQAGRPGDYIAFLGDRYCPASADPVGNANWKRNVKAILKGTR